MALFSGSSGGGRRPLGPRPFSGRESSAQSPVLRQQHDPRRATAAPFQAIPELPAPDATVSLATPSDVPTIDASDIAIPSVAEFPMPPMPVMAPSVLRVDDIRSEPFGWAPPAVPAAEPEVAESAVAENVVLADLPEATAECGAEPVTEVVHVDPVMEDGAPEIVAFAAPEVVEHDEVSPVPPWMFDSEPEAMPLEDVADAPPTQVVSAAQAEVEVPAPVEYRTPMLTPVYVNTFYDASSLAADGEAAVVEDDATDWFASADLDASASDDAAMELPVHSPWTDLADGDDVVTMETDVIAEPVLAASDPVDVPAAPHMPELASDAGIIDHVAANGPVMAQTAPVAEAMPDEWWPVAPAEPVVEVEPQPVAAPMTVMRRTPPVDGAEALDALVSETQGAERAVEALEAVARMIRSREIVVSVGAGASAESALASILASLLSHPS